MILLDCLYYIACNFYKLSKNERETDSWRGSGLILSAGSIAMFFWGIYLFSGHFRSTNDPLLYYIILVVILLILFIIRYNKYTSYAEIKEKLNNMNQTKATIFKGLATAFLIYAILGTIAIVILSVTIFKEA